MKNTFVKLEIGVLLFVAIFFILLLGNAQSFRDIPDDNLSYPVLIMTKEGHTVTFGSGFFYNKDDAIYLITASHVLFKESSVRVEKQFEIPRTLRHKIQWLNDKEKGGFLLNFLGVMSERERDELIKAVQDSKTIPNSNLIIKAIQQLY